MASNLPAVRASTAIRRPTILDENGRPLPPTARRIVDPNPNGLQTHSSHPEIGLTIESLVSYHRTAERGSPMKQFDMWDGLIERHADARGMFEERNQDVSGCDFQVLPGGPGTADRKAAEALNEWLQHNSSPIDDMTSLTERAVTSFRGWMGHQLTCVPFGFAANNNLWDVVDGTVVPVRYDCVANRRFGSPSADTAHQIWLVDSSLKRMELDPGLWSVSQMPHRNPYAAGLMRSCDWWIFFSLTGFKDWLLFAAMFGLPLAIGYYEEGAGKASRMALEEAVRAIGQDGYAVLSSLTELVIMETARGGDSSTVYPQIMRQCDQMLTKAITGGTLNTDVAGGGAGSYNAAKVHEGRGHNLKRADARRLEASFSSSIARPFCVWNGFDRAAPPRLHVKIDRGGLDRAKQLEILATLVELSASQIREEFGCREPQGEGDKVKIQEKKQEPNPSGPSGKKREAE